MSAQRVTTHHWHLAFASWVHFLSLSLSTLLEPLCPNDAWYFRIFQVNLGEILAFSPLLQLTKRPPALGPWPVPPSPSGTLSVFHPYSTYISPPLLHPPSASSLLSSFRSLLSCPFFRGSFVARTPLLQPKWHLLSLCHTALAFSFTPSITFPAIHTFTCMHFTPSFPAFPLSPVRSEVCFHWNCTPSPRH